MFYRFIVVWKCALLKSAFNVLLVSLFAICLHNWILTHLVRKLDKRFRKGFPTNINVCVFSNILWPDVGDIKEEWKTYSADLSVIILLYI